MEAGFKMKLYIYLLVGVFLLFWYCFLKVVEVCLQILLYSLLYHTCLVGTPVLLHALTACIEFEIGQPLHETSLNAIRLWFNCSLISMDKANVLHRVIMANDCSGRGAESGVCVERNSFLSNRPFVELVPSACDKGVKN